MTRLTLSFPAPAPVTLTGAPGLSLDFPAPQAVELAVQGIQAASGGGGSNLSWDAPSRTISSDTGTDAILTLADATSAGLMSSASLIALSTALQPGAAIPWADVTGKPAFAAIATSGSASDLTAGTLPAARFDDTAHGTRAGGTLHPAATTSVAGFMAAADKTKLDGIATGATANATDAALRDRATHTGTQTAATIGDFTEAAQDAVGAMVDGSLAYADATPLLQRAALTGAISAPAGSNTTSLGSFTLAQLNAAVSDADVANASHTHLLTAVTDVTMSVANLNSLDDGADSTLHFHASDRSRANHTGTQAASTISDFAEAVDDRVGALLVQGVNVTLTYNDGANTLTVAAAATDLSYTAATRLLISSTGADVTLPLVSSADAGLAPASGGGTTNFLRADGTWAAPPGGGGGVSDGSKGDVIVGFSGAQWTLAPITANVGTFGGEGLAAILTIDPKGRVTAAEAVPISIASSQIEDFADAVAATPAVVANTAKVTNATHTGDVTGATVLTIANDAVTNAKLANMATATIKGRTTAGTGVPEDLTGTQVTALLDTFTSGAKGLVPASGGGTANFLRADGTFAAPGGGSPGGSSGEIQWNNAGAFSGAADVEIEGGQLRLPAIADPTAPAAGGLKLYGSNFANRILPKIIGPSGVDTALQVGLHGNSAIMIAPASGTAAPTIWGGTLTTAATMSLQYTAGSSNRWSSTQRKRFQTSTTAGNASGMRLAYTHCHRGNAAGFGGFFFRAQLGMQINLNGGQKFVGLCASTGALGGDPSALVNMCGMGYDAGDASSGNWQFMRNDGSGTATKVDLGTGAARNTTDGYDLIMFIPPNGSDLYVRITNLNTGTVVLDTSYNTDLPAVNIGLCFKGEVRNGAVAAADNLEIAKVYIETDY